jgi:hypothetical protein
MNKTSVILFLLFTKAIFALDLNLPSSAQEYSVCGLTILSESPAVSFSNPALCHPGIITSTTRLYNIPDLFLHQVNGVFRKGFWGVGLGGYYLEYSSYTESTTNLSLSLILKNFNLGLSARYLSNQVKNYHTVHQILIDSAITWKSKRNETTFLYKNLLNQKILNIDLPVYIVWESKFHLVEDFWLAVGFEKQSREEFIYKFGTRYKILRNLTLLISCQQEPARLGTGFVINIGSCCISYGIQTHQYLPLTHSISLSYENPAH